MIFKTVKVSCPACGLRCVVSINSDSAECPDHGVISGILILETRGMQPWEALVEIMSAQRAWATRRAFDHLRSWLDNDSYLRIRIPHYL